MKNKLIYLGLVLSLIFGFSACSENNNDNWVIVTDVPEGTYVSGSAVVYTAVAPAASFKSGPVDPKEEDRTGVKTLYTWLKADGDLFITKADADGNTITLGKGADVSSLTSTLVQDGPAYKVQQDGLYFLIYNELLSQLTIVPAKYGVIGDATPNAWNGETLFTSAVYDRKTAFVELKGKFPFNKGQMKFRFNGDWGITVPYDATSTIKYHTNVGSVAAKDGEESLKDAFIGLNGGGTNILVNEPAYYDVTLRLDLRTGKFSANAIKGDLIETVVYPPKLYMTGADFGNWTWGSTGVVSLIPVKDVEGAFWCINYFKAANGFKWSSINVKDDWSKAFGKLTTNTGFTNDGEGNAHVASDGLYMVYIDIKNDKIAIEPAKIYGIGDAFGSYEEGKYPFTVTGDKATITVPKAANLRMYAASSIKTSDWWSREFNLFDGSIVYRGTGGDQAAVPVTAGQVVTLDFKTGTGTIK